MARKLQFVAIMALTVSFATAIWIDIERIRWESGNRDFLAVLHVEQRTGIPWNELAAIGVNAIALSASSLQQEETPSPAILRAAGFDLVLILDQPGLPSGGQWEPFAYLLVEKNVPVDDPLLVDLLSKGDTLLLREAAENSWARRLWDRGFQRMFRAHEVPDKDLPETPTETLPLRFERAVRERGIRCLILPPLLRDNLKDSLQDDQAIIAGVVAAGYTPGKPSLLLPLPHRIEEILLHIGVSALFFLVLFHLVRKLPWICFFFAAGFVAIVFPTDEILLRQIDALLIALLAPLYGVFLFLPQRRASWQSGLECLARFSLLTIAAGMFLAALLSHPAFLVKAAEFRGVKVSLLLPPLAAGILYAHRTIKGRFKERLRPSRRLVGIGCLLAASAFIACVILLRSGTVEALVTGIELQIRRFLEHILVARPRFKEFLIGHPLLLLFGSGHPATSWRNLIRPFLLALGLVGQVSILNTFAHAHTPLLLSLWRTGNGLLLGCIVGLFLTLSVALVERRYRQSRSRSR